MPTPSDIERLQALAKGSGPKDEDAFSAEEKKTLSRDSTVHVSVHVDTPQKDSGAPKKKHWVQHVAQNPWAHLVGALLLGAGGGEGHRLLSPTGIVEKADLAHHKEEIARELGQEDGKIEALKQEEKDAMRQCVLDRDADRRAMYALGRYLYFVLPKTGVLVTLPEDVVKPVAMDFHPPPLFTGNLKPDAAKPIQPAETFPLPFPPEK
jgi:hypothetical protein